MINLEIVVTLVAMLVAFFIVMYFLQKGSTRKRRIKQDLETLELARQLKCDTRKPENLTALGLQPFHIKSEKASAIHREGRTAYLFAALIFCAFLAWGIYLMNLQLVEAAFLTLGFAIVCVFAMLYAKRKILQARTANAQLQAELERYENTLTEPTEIATPKVEATEQVSPTAVITSKPAAVESSDIPLCNLYQVASGYDLVPEDSTLKRHFVSSLVVEIVSSLPPRPTDSILKRHHDALIFSEFEQRLQTLSQEPAVEAVVSSVAVQPRATKQPPAVAVPEDSMLRRHFLSQLRREIEAGFGSRPTDSTLKRHYDAMVDAEYETRIQALLFASSAENDVAEEPVQKLPEDSMLRRHFLAELQARIAAKLPPRPSDFNLQRHYNAMIQERFNREIEQHYH
ncbi:hypothetical protein Q9L42_008655 [Methylomarinum sp. Ch1-1]|uniref:Uncharacterized protein n=1 Tax=Methylomarinum roseum TaxID=3067653 RepID=A0AAU7NYP9_9GAMM|nr:hypothetical protein [Methylomarinum sp. Ch1-1]MDP4521700.1 hypothetical protein [Methylomarinum sp. Ch1-1]